MTAMLGWYTLSRTTNQNLDCIVRLLKRRLIEGKGSPGLVRTGFFLTSAVRKTKTLAQNSSQKLKKKTQAPGDISQKSKKLKKKSKF